MTLGTQEMSSSTLANERDVEKGVEENPVSGEELPPAATSDTTSDPTRLDHVSSSSEDEEGQVEKAEGSPLEKHESQADKMSKTRVLLIILSLCIALFLAALDMTIITTALPTISDHFKASDADYTWVGSAYLLACAAAVPAWGKVSDIFGRKPMLLTANLIFFAGSLFCALSTSINMLIGARVLQGAGGGGLIVLVNIVIADLFSLRERGQYIGIMGMVWAVAAAVGPVIGGAFAEKVSWRWCFYINLPLDGISLILLVFFLKIKTPKTPLTKGLKAIDWIGLMLIIGGVVMFLLGLEAGGVTKPWSSAYTLCLVIFGLVTMGVFFVYEWRFAKYPVIPVHLFQDRTRVACLLTCFCHGFVFIPQSYFLPLYFQTVLGASPLLSGIYYFPYAITLAIVSAGAGITIKKTGAYQQLIWGGMFLLTIGVGLYISFPAHADWPKIIIFQIISGFGTGPNFQSPLVALQSTIKPSDIATATATFGFIRQIATSMSVVLGGVVFANQMSQHQGQLISSLGPAVAQRVGKASSGSSAAYIRSLPEWQRKIVGQTITESLRTMWIFYTVVAFVGLLCSLLIGKKHLSREHQTQEQGLEAQERARKERLEDERRRKEEKKKQRRSSASPAAAATMADKETMDR